MREGLKEMKELERRWKWKGEKERNLKSVSESLIEL